ncbi:MAG: response regulator [Firmicutes bacterium]|nr:response regulator [Bacillota bacterium]
MFNILVVDDDKNNRFSIGALLEELSVNVIEAEDGESALGKLMEKKIDLIILDVQLPDYNGFQLAKMIKSRKSTKEIPIILATAVFKAQVFVEQGFEAGAIDYVLKPINNKILTSKVKYYIKLDDEKNAIILERNMYKNAIDKICKSSNYIVRIYGPKLIYSNDEDMDNDIRDTIDEAQIDEMVNEALEKGRSYKEDIRLKDIKLRYEAINLDKDKQILLLVRVIS